MRLKSIADSRQVRAKSTELRIWSQELKTQSSELIHRSQKLLAISEEINIFKELTILIVDDSHDCLILNSYILKSYGIQVMTASSASAAFELIKKSRVDILIIDLAMPEEDGYSLITKVKKFTDAQKIKIPAIALTARSEDETRELALAYGFEIYLQKPLERPEQLIKAIAKLVRSSCKNNLCNLKTTASYSKD